MMRRNALCCLLAVNVLLAACAIGAATDSGIDQITVYRGDQLELDYRPAPGAVVKWHYSDGAKPATQPATEPATAPAPLPPPVSTPPTLATVTRPIELAPGQTVQNIRRTSTDPDARGITIDAADCTVRNLVLDGPNIRYGLFLKNDCRNLRVIGYRTTEKIRGDLLYDNGGGKASNILIDLDGGTLHGSLEENGFRIHAKFFTLRNGTVLFYDRTSKGVKAGITIQDGSESVTIEDLTLTGAMGIGPVETGQGWQTERVKGVTVRRLNNPKGRNINIQNGASAIVFEDVAWTQVDNRPLITFEVDNPNFKGQKPDVIFRRCTFAGGSALFDDRGRADVTLIDCTYNGKAVR